MAIDPVVIEFLAKGVPDVSRAFATIERQAQRSSDSVGRSVARETQGREREAQKAVRAAEKAANAELRAKERAAKAAERLIQQESKLREREAKRAADAQIREDERAHRVVLRNIQNRERARERGQARADRDQRRVLEQGAGILSRGAAAGISRVGNVAGGVVRTALDVGGGLSLQDSLRKEVAFQRNAALLSNSAYVPNDPKHTRPDVKMIMERARAASAATGIEANDLVEGVRSYTAKSSDFAGGMENMEFFGRMSKATGTSVQDIANAAGLLRSQNADLTGAQMKDMLLSVVAQGKLGSVEMEDLATGAARITRSSAGYQGSQTVNQQKLLGLAQIAARTSGGSVSESATNLSNIGADALKHQGAIGKITNDRGQLISPDALVEMVFDKTQGDLSKMQNQMKFGARSMKFFQALAPVYNSAYDSTDGDRGAKHAAAMKAIRAEMDPLTKATYSQEDLTKDFQTVMASGAEKFDIALMKLRQSMGEKLAPEFEKLIPVLEKVGPQFIDMAAKGLPAFVDLLKTIADFAEKNKAIIKDLAAHPIGTLIAYEITKSFASAALPELLKALMTKAFAGAAPGGGGLGGAGGSSAAGGAAAVAGAVLIADTKVGIDATLAGQREGIDKAATLPAQLMSRDKATRDAAMMEYESAKQGTGLRGTANLVGAVSSLSYNTLSSMVTGEKNASADTIRKFALSKEIVDSPAIQAAVTKAIEAGARNGMQQAAVTSPGAAARNAPIPARSGK